jgi:hypothetical protein
VKIRTVSNPENSAMTKLVAQGFAANRTIGTEKTAA